MVINFDNPEKKNQEKNELWPSLQDQQCNFLSYHFSFFEESLFPLHEPALCSVNYLSTSATANKIHKQISSTKHLPPIKKISKKYFPSAQRVTNSLVKKCKSLIHNQCIKLNTMVCLDFLQVSFTCCQSILVALRATWPQQPHRGRTGWFPAQLEPFFNVKSTPVSNCLEQAVI